MVKRAVIIAAGRGLRLNGENGGVPKPLTKIGGLPLLKRVILSAKDAGIEECVIVVGYRGAKIRRKIEKDKNIKVNITWVYNNEWDKSNGLSVLAAKDKVKGRFVLLMSDHVFQPQTLKSLLRRGDKMEETILCVDKKLDRIFDMDDATKVKLNVGMVADIGKEIDDFDAVDTGMFLCTEELFYALENAKNHGDCSLSDGVRFLAREDKMRAMNIGDAFWQDVDTPESLRHAEKLLLHSVTKPTDGFIAKNLNRKISLRISRLLANTSITPNQITALNFLMGILSAYLISQRNYVHILLGALLFKLTSIVDGVDGEVAKLKFKESRVGQWFDTITDNIVYLAFFIGLILGIYNRDPFPYPDPGLLIGGASIVGGIIMSLSFMYTFLKRSGISGSLVSYAQLLDKFISNEDCNLIIRTIHRFKPTIRRDFFALFFLVLVLFNKVEWILWVSAVAVNLTGIVIIFTSGAMARNFQGGTLRLRPASRK